MEEEWVSMKPIGYSKYEASPRGLIRTVKTSRISKGNPHLTYYRSTLSDDNGKSSHIMTHVLIARIFLGEPPDKSYTVDHIDKNRTNNCVSNLRWATRSEQNSNRTNVPRKRGTRPITQILPSGEKFFTWFKIADAAKSLGLVPSNFIKVALNGGKLGGYYWEFCTEDIEGEIWKRCNVDKSILISNMGRFFRTDTEKIGVGNLLPSGYRSISLKNDGRPVMFMHVLVASTFLGEKPGCEVNHKNGNKKDNKLSNLEYITHVENIVHAIKTGLRTYEKNKGGSREVKQLNLKGEIINTFPSLTEASRQTGISKGNICSGIRPAAGGYKWKY